MTWQLAAIVESLGWWLLPIALLITAGICYLVAWMMEGR